MRKVVRRVINDQYTSIKPDSLVEGTVIPFDCYIKRFGDYVIILKAGTLLTKELYEKIVFNETIYLHNSSSKIVKEYYAANKIDDSSLVHVSKSDSIRAVKGLALQLKPEDSIEKRLNIVYAAVGQLMQTIFEDSDEILPIETLRECAVLIEQLVHSDTNVMPLLLQIIPEEYSTCYHSTNVAFYAAILGKATDLSKEGIIDVAFAGLMLDIGKLRTDKLILLKSGALSDSEYAIMKRHCDDGHAILEANGITNQSILNGVRYHHEKLDRSGYPKQLSGKLIPMFARLLAVCDVFDALTTKRTYRTDYTSFEALMLIKREMSAQFDERFVDAFIRLLR